MRGIFLSYNTTMRFQKKPNTSWQKVSKWYSGITKGSGHYFHEHVVIPKVLTLLQLTDKSSLLDLGCGTGALARLIPKGVAYTGVDIAKGMIDEARKYDHDPKHTYVIADVTRAVSANKTFTHATFILSLQNIKDQKAAIKLAAEHLSPNGILVIVLNHPAFRIPRQSSWEIDPQNKLEYRRINRYLTPLEVPVNMHPSERDSAITWSYHVPISSYSDYLKENGFVIESLEEWASDKQSSGKHAKMENRARSEFPLFLAIKAKKLTPQM